MQFLILSHKEAKDGDLRKEVVENFTVSLPFPVQFFAILPVNFAAAVGISQKKRKSRERC